MAACRIKWSLKADGPFATEMPFFSTEMPYPSSFWQHRFTCRWFSTKYLATQRFWMIIYRICMHVMWCYVMSRHVCMYIPTEQITFFWYKPGTWSFWASHGKTYVYNMFVVLYSTRIIGWWRALTRCRFRRTVRSEKEAAMMRKRPRR